MDALDVFRVCLKRWYVMAPVVLFAVVTGVNLTKHVQPTYTAYGMYTIIYQHADLVTTKTDPRDLNPLGVAGGGLVGEALESTFMSAPYQAKFGDPGTSGTGPGVTVNGTSFTITLPQDTQSYVVQTWGSDPDKVKQVVDAVLQSAPGTADSIQARAGAPEDSRYTTFTTTPAQVSKLATSSRAKILIAMTGLGLVAGASFAVLADALFRRRRRRRSERSDESRLMTRTPADDESEPDGRKQDLEPALAAGRADEESIEDPHQQTGGGSFPAASFQNGRELSRTPSGATGGRAPVKTTDVRSARRLRRRRNSAA